jgi:hypothetical protein
MSRIMWVYVGVAAAFVLGLYYIASSIGNGRSREGHDEMRCVKLGS